MYPKLPERGHVYRSQRIGRRLAVGDQRPHGGAGPHRGGPGGGGGEYPVARRHCVPRALCRRSFTRPLQRSPSIIQEELLSLDLYTQKRRSGPQLSRLRAVFKACTCGAQASATVHFGSPIGHLCAWFIAFGSFSMIKVKQPFVWEL